ncbi:NAD(+) hydrolase sarm1-like isoform X2 [Mercenaria mercenaria]|uniref:NAD(+) hydrolase sarm1-like isoform X2 n=1 Tax=Mercenaria mercenaria TaxID=6596 RepID=UPI00234F53D3|nr:NAD(+) hydrolase sarm1-like isoform X2 [Mercenaria mercenaria]
MSGYFTYDEVTIVVKMAEANVNDSNVDGEEEVLTNGLDDESEESFKIDRFDSSAVPHRSMSDAELTERDIHRVMLGNAMSFESFDDVDDEPPLSGKRVSESSRVYFDLSNIDSETESISTASSAMKDVRYKLRMNQALQTIPQKEVLVTKKTTKVSYSSMSSRSYSADALDDIDESGDSVEPEFAPEYVDVLHNEKVASSFYSKYPLLVSQSPGASDSHAAWQNKNNLKLKYQQFCASLERDISELKRATGSDEIKPLKSILEAMTDAWNFPVYGRDLACGLCDIIRNESVLSLLVKNCDNENHDVLLASSTLLEQVMSLRNRETVTKEGLEKVVKMSQRAIGVQSLALSTVGILENLFKVSGEISTSVIQHGGLDSVLYWCRSNDTKILRKCAKALSNLSLFGGPDNQEIMTQQKVPEWLFPLAFSEDKHVKYYACLSIAVLVANKELEAQVIKSGTLDLVIPFVSAVKPEEFAKSDYAHRQGRDSVWLERLKPLLCSRRPEAQALAAFHFAMEAAIKSEQGKNEIFYDIGVIEPLRKVASSPNAVASRLAREALQTIGEETPHKLSQQVPLWTTEDVSHWVSEIGFKEYAPMFEDCKIDGDLLLQMDENDMIESIQMKPGMIRRRFQRELVNLKVTADYSSYDPTKIDPWLMSVLPELSQYTYAMLRNGMDRTLLSTTTEDELKDVCGVNNGIHRRIIMQHLNGLAIGTESDITPDASSYLRSTGGLVTRSSIDCGASLAICPRPVDVFISYRRSTGSQLASLLKVHLQLRGFSVFLDIDRLRAGKFDENLLMNIKLAKHFLLVLTTNALDRCIGDMDRQDWVHKEIVTALESQCNIIPILDNCDWPEPEQLPEDMRPVCYFNGIRWVHEYQDACINKVESFLRGELKSLPDKMCHTKALKKSASGVSGTSSRGSKGNLTPQNSFELPKPKDWTIEDTPIIGSLVDS